MSKTLFLIFLFGTAYAHHCSATAVDSLLRLLPGTDAKRQVAIYYDLSLQSADDAVLSLQYGRTGLAIARENGYADVIPKLLVRTADALIGTGNFHAAIGYAEEAYSLYNSSRDEKGIATSLNLLGIAH